MAISKVFSQNVRFRFHLSSVYVVLSLAFFICPSQAIQLPKGCAKVASAWAKNPSVETLVQEPDFVTNSVDCLQGAFKLIQETDWQTVQAMMPYEVKHLIQNIRLNLISNAKAFATGGGLVFLSSYLLYKSTELSEQAKGLELDKLYQDEFELLQLQLAPIMSLIDEILQDWKNGNNNKLVNWNIDKISEKLSRSSTILREVVDRIHNNIKKCESGKAWSVSYTIFAAGVCGGSIITCNPTFFVPACGFFVVAAVVNVENHDSLEKTLSKSESLRENAMELRIEITKYRTSLDLAVSTTNLPLECVGARSSLGALWFMFLYTVFLLVLLGLSIALTLAFKLTLTLNFTEFLEISCGTSLYQFLDPNLIHPLTKPKCLTRLSTQFLTTFQNRAFRGRTYLPPDQLYRKAPDLGRGV